MRLTPFEAAYLMAIFRINEGGRVASSGHLADFFKVKQSSAIDMLRRLESNGLIKRKLWQEVKLTYLGLSIATKFIHNHRVLEIYFTDRLGLSKNISCREASKIDYMIGDRVIRKMCSEIGYLEKCIHGKPVMHKKCI